VIDRLIVAGLLIRIHHGVYAVGHARLSARGRWMAAVLACGDGARLSHRDALALHDVRRIGSGAVHVTAPRLHRLAGIRCHTVRDQSRLGDVIVDSIPVTSLERAVLDEAVTLSAQRLRALLEEIERRDRFDLRRFSAEVDASPGHHGAGRLRAALAAMSDMPPELRSGLERAFLTLVRTAGLPEPSANVVVAGELFDFHWPSHHVLVETDSWRYHRSRRSFENDRRRANAAVLAGETLLRVTDARIDEQPASVIDELAAALGRGG
jgi:very-short-patch-repair endonuclease